MRATAEVYGLEAAAGLRGEIVRRYTSADYGWMWPFPATVERWFDAALSEIADAPRNVGAGSPPRGIS